MRQGGLRGWNAESEFRELLTQVRELFQRGPNLERRILMALQADVQRLIDAVTANTSAAKSAEQALQAQGKQIDDLKAAIAGLQAGQVIGPDDLQTLRAGIDQLSATNTELQSAVPANTPEGPVVAPAGTLGPDGKPVEPNTGTNPAPQA